MGLDKWNILLYANCTNTVNTVKLDSGSTINNYKYKNGSAEAVQITENAILTLYYSEIIFIFQHFLNITVEFLLRHNYWEK